MIFYSIPRKNILFVIIILPRSNSHETIMHKLQFCNGGDKFKYEAELEMYNI